MTKESSTQRRLGSALTKKERKDGLSLFRNLKILCPAGCLIRFRSLSLVSLRLFLQPSDFLSLALLFECEKFSSASLEGSNKVSVYLREIFNIVKQIISCLHGNEIFLDLLKTMQQTYMFTFETLFFLTEVEQKIFARDYLSALAFVKLIRFNKTTKRFRCSVFNRKLHL